jgi:pyridoxine kinase
MPLALILSSYVAASRVGGGAQQFALAPFGIDPVLVPTVLFGRSPAKGPPGGAAVDADTFAAMLEGVEAEGVFRLADLVITGHFSLAEQVEQAALAIEKVRAAPREGAFSPRPRIIVDPVLGDEPKGLYVKPEVAEAVAARLVPLADWLTPNAWELSHLTGRSIAGPAGAAAAAKAVGKPCLVSSVPAGEGRIGLVCHDGHFARLYTHERLAFAPNGTGDLLTAVFAAQLLLGLAPLIAAEGAARTVLEAVRAAAAWNAPELPLVALGESLVRPTARVAIEDLP